MSWYRLQGGLKRYRQRHRYLGRRTRLLFGKNNIHQLPAHLDRRGGQKLTLIFRRGAFCHYLGLEGCEKGFRAAETFVVCCPAAGGFDSG